MFPVLTFLVGQRYQTTFEQGIDVSQAKGQVRATAAGYTPDVVSARIPEYGLVGLGSLGLAGGIAYFAPGPWKAAAVLPLIGAAASPAIYETYFDDDRRPGTGPPRSR